MVEVRRLIQFMNKRHQKRISLGEYILEQEKLGEWSKKRHYALKSELCFTEELLVTYNQKDNRTETILCLKSK